MTRGSRSPSPATVKAVADGLATLALEVTCGDQKVLGMPKAVVRV